MGNQRAVWRRGLQTPELVECVQSEWAVRYTQFLREMGVEEPVEIARQADSGISSEPGGIETIALQSGMQPSAPPPGATIREQFLSPVLIRHIYVCALACPRLA